MQKTDRKASILIWAIFLSLTISISFISISSKINKNIKSNHSLINKFDNLKNIENKIKNNDFGNEKFPEKEEITFYQNKIFTWSLKNNETSQIKYAQSSNFDITILSGWPIFYTTSWSLSSSWIIDTNLWITSLSWTLDITNLWWYSKVNITSDNTFFPPEITYKVTKKIWNKEIIKNFWIIKNN